VKVAALDLGTNTFILLIADVVGGRVTRVYHDEVRVVRLGQGVHQTRRLHPEALARAEDCFAAFAKVIAENKVEKTLACATSAARDVINGQELVALAAKFNIPVQIISGEQEADATFWGTFDRPPEEPKMIIDIGGGSTEFIYGDKTGILARRSVDIGSVRLTELFVTEHPIPAIELAKLTGYVQPRLTEARAQLGNPTVESMIAVAGTPTTLAMIEMGLAVFSSDRVDGYVLRLESLRHWVRRLAEMSVAERQGLIGMEPKRADVIVAGAMILTLAAQTFGCREFVVSARGLRYGIALQMAVGK
jgi:exopolyphosphatase / guanosine-5'-triphosphate,3'-diphosphate pyrophosphatase